jgi:hypothetical protein
MRAKSPRCKFGRNETIRPSPPNQIKSNQIKSNHPNASQSLPALCPSSFTPPGLNWPAKLALPCSLHGTRKFRFLSSTDHVPPSFRQPLALITLALAIAYLTLPLPSPPPTLHPTIIIPRTYRIRSPGLFASIVSCRYLGPSCPFVSPVFSILPAFPSESKFS